MERGGPGADFFGSLGKSNNKANFLNLKL
jgi:hypothetical protein